MLHVKQILLVAGSACALTVAMPAAAVDFSADGDVRTGFFSAHRDTRSGNEDTTDEFRLRLRAGITAKLNQQWAARIRFAGRYSTDDRNENHFRIFDRIPSGDGLRRGDSTLDEIYVDYHADKNWSVRAGRFQSSFELKGVAKKSLDRNTSPNTDITWTDGVQLKYKAANGWQSTFIAQYNDDDGATEVRRGPLDFTDDNSRVTYFAGFENTQQVGPIVQRAIDVSWLPDALHDKGVGAGSIEDYWGVVGRLAAQWPMSGTMKFMLAGEVGYAPNTPERSVTRTGTQGDADGLAAQLTFNFLDIVPSHSVGLVVGRAGDGWLLSPDFRDNTNLLEARYKWEIDKKQKFEARVRHREDIDQRVGATDKQEDVDYYLRYTYKF